MRSERIPNALDKLSKGKRLQNEGVIAPPARQGEWEENGMLRPHFPVPYCYLLLPVQSSQHAVDELYIRDG